MGQGPPIPLAHRCLGTSVLNIQTIVTKRLPNHSNRLHVIYEIR